jgi:hypothetical protein
MCMSADASLILDTYSLFRCESNVVIVRYFVACCISITMTCFICCIMSMNMNAIWPIVICHVVLTWQATDLIGYGLRASMVTYH